MPSAPWLILAIVAFTLAVDWIVVRSLVRMGWGNLSDRFPARPIAPDAVRRDFQSFSFDIFNFGFSVHAAADSTHLHLLPAAFMRLMGCTPMSIPWGAISVVSRRGRWIKAKVAGSTVKGPAWCLALADPAASAPSAGSGR